MLSVLFTIIWSIIAVAAVFGVIGIIVSNKDKSKAPTSNAPSPAQFATITATVQTCPCVRREAAIARVSSQWQ